MTKCIYLKIRSRKYKRYIYCSDLKKEITYNDCNGCKDKQYKKVKPLKQRTSKQAKLEKERYSIFTNDLEHCIENKYHTGKIDKHEIYRGRNRRNSIKYGLVIPLCRDCHNNAEIEREWRVKGQLKFIKHYNKTKEEFIKEFGRNYLE